MFFYQLPKGYHVFLSCIQRVQCFSIIRPQGIMFFPLFTQRVQCFSVIYLKGTVFFHQLSKGYNVFLSLSKDRVLFFPMNYPKGTMFFLHLPKRCDVFPSPRFFWHLSKRYHAIHSFTQKVPCFSVISPLSIMFSIT